MISRLLCASAFLCALWASPSAATPLSYDLTIPLVAIGSSDDLGSNLTRRGTLSYDADAMTGSGTFSIGDLSDAFSGFSLLLDYDDGTTGILFDGAGTGGGSLYFNVLASLADQSGISGIVTYCRLSGCAFFSGIGGTVDPADQPGLPVTLPTPDPGPSLGFSPVPLPPAAALFGTALLALGLAAARRSKSPRRLAVAHGSARRVR